MTKSQIEASNKKIWQVMQEEANINIPDNVLNKLNNLCNVLGLSSQCVAESEYLYNVKIGELFSEHKSLSATDKKILFQSLAAEEIKLLNYSAQLNKDLHYAIEACRSMLSYIKSEMEQSLRSN